MIIERICVADASISVEAVIESIVSIYKGPNKKGDCFLEERIKLNMLISESGPKLEHPNSLP